MKKILAFAAFAVAALAASPITSAADWPTKPVRVIVPFAPGSGTDVIMRFYAVGLAQTFKQPFIVENRPGANGLIGTAAGAKSAPDGYTLYVISNSTVSAAPFVYKSVPYDVDNDVLPVAPFIEAPSLLFAEPNFPADNFDQFLAYARSKKATLSFAYANSAGLAAGVALRNKAGLDIVAVPYKSSPQGVNDVMGGQVPLMIVDTIASSAAVKGKKVKVFAVTSARRSPMFPDLPAMSEKFPGIDIYAWVGLGAPAGMDPAIVSQINAEVSRISKEKKTQDFFTNLGATTAQYSPAEYKTFVSGQNRHWATQLKDAGVQPE